jgi:hypothetical protein
LSEPRALRALLLAAGWAAGPALAFAQGEVVVTSPRPDAVAVTIYRDDLALITATRTVSLPASPVTLVLDGVIETLLPQSAVLADAGRGIVESDFTFDRLTPRSLLAKSIGATVTITRTNRRTGAVTREQATIVSAGEGVVLRIGSGYEALYCAGLPERLELREVPSDLLAKPQLAIKLGSGETGTRTVKVSYLAHGFAWSSDYVAHLNAAGDRMRLEGWATLSNSTGSAFEQAEVQLVAGRLNVLPAEQRGSAAEPVYPNGGESTADARLRVAAEQAASEVALLRNCFATQLRPEMLAGVAPTPLMMRRMVADNAALEEVVVTGARLAQREELGDYQLYRVPWPTDLGARQTKQVAFLAKPAVRVERFYSLRLETFADPPREEVSIPSLVVRFENDARFGAGEPLPSGTVRVLEPHGAGEVFAGEAEIGDTPAGVPLELAIGRALDVAVAVTMERSEGRGKNGAERLVVTTEHRIVNNKGLPVDFEIRHPVASGLRDVKVEQSSRTMRRKLGDLAWRFELPAASEQVLRYRLSALEP